MLKNVDAGQIASWYEQKISGITGVKRVIHKNHKNGIDFVVVVDRICRALSYELSKIESQLCDEFSDWIFDFEHISQQAFSQRDSR
jgi:hypothetical protein